MNWEPKRNYIRNLVNYEEKQRSYVKNESRREGSFQYRLQTGNDKVKVWRNMFLSTLGLKQEWVANPTVYGMPRTRDEKKKTIKQKIIRKYLKAPSKFSFSELRAREEKLVKCYEDYETEQTKIAMSEMFSDNQDDEDGEEVKNTYFNSLSNLRDCILDGTLL
ncbi:hypothetical protein HHI36_014842 [Cryptolaemus montrouzieri]|uniref:Uncharacterized protein n=1 Tax=Cryptolaemus montrouzieri TaxID=559131 RepID=A0ABD2N3S4_9CUCU